MAEARLRLLLSGVVGLSSITLYSMLKLLTITPDCEKLKMNGSRRNEEERKWNLRVVAGGSYLPLAGF